MLAMTLMMVSFLLILGFMMAMTPYVTRKNIQFGVMLPEEANQHLDIQTLKKKFAIYNIGLSLVSTLPILIGFILNFTEEYILWSGMIMMIVFLIINFLLYYVYYRKVKALKQQHFNVRKDASEARIMVSTDFRDKKPLIIPNKIFITIGILIILVTLLIPVIFYDQIPDYLPTHFEASGKVTTVSPKSMAIFVFLPVMQLFMLAIMAFVNYILKYTKQMIKPKNPKVSVEQNRAYRYAMSKYIVALGIGILLMFSLFQFITMAAIENLGWINIFLLITLMTIIIPLIYLAFKYGQGGERYQLKEAEKKHESYQLVDDDKYWKLGMFYYNANDPAVWVEKRFGLGVTSNFAHWQSWAILIGILILTVAPIVIAFFI